MSEETNYKTITPRPERGELEKEINNLLYNTVSSYGGHAKAIADLIQSREASLIQRLSEAAELYVQMVDENARLKAEGKRERAKAVDFNLYLQRVYHGKATIDELYDLYTQSSTKKEEDGTTIDK